MAHLTALPNELLLQIFTSCPTIQSAVLLSGGNSTLHGVWATYHEHIVTSILKRDSVDGPESGEALAQALALAKDEARLMSSSPSGTPYASPGSFVPRLVFHKDAAARVGAQYMTWMTTLQTKQNGRFVKAPLPTALSSSYYMTRRLVLSYHFPELQTELRAAVETAPLDTIATHLELAEFMYNCVDEQGKGMLGVLETKFTTTDAMLGYPASGAWKFAVNLLLRTYAKRRLCGQPQSRNVHLARQFEMYLRR
nr:hypothetical protein CFP56_09028 [Quercus suber]